MLPPIDSLVVPLVAFLLAGFVKGVLGFGFPIVALVILTLVQGLFDALAIIVVPTLVTNVWQGMAGPYLADILRRMGLYFGVAALGVLVASGFISVVNVNLLTGLLGLILVTFAVSRLLNVRIEVAPRHEVPLSLTLGAINGVLTGFTGTFMVPSVLYMQALGFRKDMLVQAMGVFFSLSTLMLMISLGRNALLDAGDMLFSSLALVPSFIGIYAGRWTRDRIDERQFQLLFLASVLVLGAYIIWRSLAALTAA